ncbi:MAG: hypothetical protein WC379_10830 [Methanoregula sp.]|jgi:hypothetical protein
MVDSIEYHLKPLHDLSAWLQGFTLKDVSIGPEGEFCVLAVSAEMELHGQSYEITTSEPFTYKLFISKTGRVTEITLPDQYWNFQFFQPIQQDLLLLTTARARLYQDGTFDRNAKIFDRHGRLVREFLLGDDIACLQVTREDTIWTGYDEQGIWGNYGWGIPDGLPPVGNCGLRSWDAWGNPRYRFNDHKNPFYCCPVLNVIRDDEVWFYNYYRGWLVRIRNNEDIDNFPTFFDVGSDIAISDNYVVFFGEYRDRFRFLLGELLKADGSLAIRKDFTFFDESGLEIETGPFSPSCRGSSILFLHNYKLYSADVKDIVKQFL